MLSLSGCCPTLYCAYGPTLHCAYSPHTALRLCGDNRVSCFQHEAIARTQRVEDTLHYLPHTQCGATQYDGYTVSGYTVSGYAVWGLRSVKLRSVRLHSMMATLCQATQYVAAETAISLLACQRDTTKLPVPRPKHEHLAHWHKAQALIIRLKARLVFVDKQGDGLKT